MTAREKNNTAKEADRELILTRIFDAPRALVFRMWTDPKHLARWWGPKGSDNPVCKIDAWPGGKIFMQMRGPGFDHPMGGEFREIDPPHRLVFTTLAYADANNDYQLQNLITVTFEEASGKTKLTMHVVVQKATPEMAGPLSGMAMGWSQSFDRLADLLIKVERHGI